MALLIRSRCRHGLLCLILLFIGCILTAALPAQSLYTFHHPAMGTEFSLYIYSANQYTAEELSSLAFDEIDRIEAELSNYRQDSELSRINRDAFRDTVTTDPETFRFLAESRLWSVRSQGAFDITVGSLMKTWGFFRANGHVPAVTELDELRPAVGFHNLMLDAETRSVRFAHPGVELDPGGIGKGFAVDAAVKLLRESGVHSALLSAGSSTLYALGAPPHLRGWRVVIPSVSGSAPLSSIWLRNTSLSSANCREKHFFSSSGQLYCHIMDPRSLQPVEGRLHVSIVHPSATASDAISNVLFVKTPREGLAFLRRSAPKARAFIVAKRGSKMNCTLYRWPTQVDQKTCRSGSALHPILPKK